MDLRRGLLYGLLVILASTLVSGCGTEDAAIVGAGEPGSATVSRDTTDERTFLYRDGDEDAQADGVRWYLSTARRLLDAPGETSGTVSLDGAGGANHDGTPYHAATFQISGLQGACSGEPTRFSLPLDAGSAAATGTQARVSYDFEGDGQVDRVETYAYFANNDLPGWETYRETRGLRSANGSMRDFVNGTARLEVWNAIGRYPVEVRIDDASAYVELPLSGSPTTSPSPTPPPSSAPPGEFSGTLYPAPSGLTAEPGTGELTLAGADGATHDGRPYRPLSLQATGLWGSYDGGSTDFRVLVDAGKQVACGTQLRLSYDFDGDGTPERVETYHYFPTDNVPGFESYTQARGMRSMAGAWADFQGGTLSLEAWSALGDAPTTLGLEGSRLKLPMVSDTADPSDPAPTTSPSPTPPPSSTPSGEFSGTLYPAPGGLTAEPGTGELTLASADGGTHDGQPYRPLSLRATGLWGGYDGGSTAFRVRVDARDQVACATQLRLSYDFDGDTSPDRVETYHYFPTDNVPGWESYTQARGIRSVTGAWADFQDGTLTLEVWSALGRAPMRLGLDGSHLELPVVGDTAGPAPEPEPAPETWVLTWHDEFDGPNGSQPNSDNWVIKRGGGGFGNNELQSYTDRWENLRVEDGHLIIEARKESYTGADGIRIDYTSARLKTLGKFVQQYGKIEARMKIPEGQGMWPAFWMMGEDKAQVGWPACGEIDVMENVGRDPYTVHGTVHGPGYSGSDGIGDKYRLPSGEKFSDDFHVYSIEWERDSIRWLVDGDLYHTLTRDMLPEGAPWEFNKPFFLLVNLAVGGYWPGPPDSTTTFPQKLKVDYVRAYQLTP